ncbi:MAG: protein tyrosine phosphatase, partial [Planctomycetota bacterium]
ISRPLDDQLISLADMVLTLTRGHRLAVLATWPEVEDRVFTLRKDGGDIADPVGAPLNIYQKCGDQIDAELQKWLDTIDESWIPIEEQ